VSRPLVALVCVLVLTAGCTGATDLLGPSEWGVDEVSEDVGFTYASQASGVGNGDAGVYASDVNNDGWPDLLAIGGDQPVLFENTGGAFERSDALPAVDMAVQGALFFDADGDGWEDLLLLPREGNATFLRNDGGTFTKEKRGLGDAFDVGVGASAADYDGDGDVDVFVVQYGNWADGTPDGYLQSEGYVSEDNGNPNVLYENTGDGFERVENAGIRGAHWSLATSFVDLTGDGAPDVHVANDFNNDTLYVNQGDGTFERRVLGTETSRNGMSSEVADVSGDGRPDVFVTNIYFPLDEANLTEERRARLENYFSFVLRSKRIAGNNLLVNRGDGTFGSEAAAYGVREGGWGWAAVISDLDNDRDPDVFHATQNVFRFDEEDPHYTYPMVWTRGSEGYESRDASDLGFEELDGRGVAALDFDRDGDVDLAVSAYNGEFVLYENRAERLGNNALDVRAVESNGATTALGARVTVTVDGETQTAIQHARSDYQSQDSRVLHFGLGDRETVDRLQVVWPDGTRQTLRNVTANQYVTVAPDGTVTTTET